MNKNNVDVVSLGETMIRYTPKGNKRLEQARELEVGIGGSEANFSILLSRFGMNVKWISKLPNSPLGRFIVQKIRGFGVDTSDVIWTDKYRVGKYYIEFGKAPRISEVIYDRDNAAITKIKPDDVNWKAISDARVFHTTGITMALSESCRRTILQAVSESRKNKTKVSFDLNYRSKLWSPKEAKKALGKVLDGVDILIADREDVRRVLGISGSKEEVAETLANRFDLEVSVLTLGKKGAIAEKNGELFEGEPFEIEEIDRIGAGDAFDAGFLHGYMDSGVQKGLDYGLASAALKHTIPGDLAVITREEVEEILSKRKLGREADVRR